MIDETFQRCHHAQRLMSIQEEADRVRNMLVALDVAVRLQEPALAGEIYSTVQRRMLGLVRDCVLAP